MSYIFAEIYISILSHSVHPCFARAKSKTWIWEKTVFLTLIHALPTYMPIYLEEAISNFSTEFRYLYTGSPPGYQFLLPLMSGMLPLMINVNVAINVRNSHIFSKILTSFKDLHSSDLILIIW